MEEIKYFTNRELLRIVNRSEFPDEVKLKLRERIKRRLTNSIPRSKSIFHHLFLLRLFDWGPSAEELLYWNKYATIFNAIPIVLKYKTLKEL